MAQLDFIVIGAQKAGTTSLWQYLKHHPEIAMPPLKEHPFFSTEHATGAGALEGFVVSQFGDVPAGALRGKVTTAYMKGSEHADTREIARRISIALPDVKLIALLRDPIERAVSQYRMSVRRGIESRPFDRVVEELLLDEQLPAGREAPTETNSYIAQGEYGRILGGYLVHFPRSSIHVEQLSELSHDPGSALDRILEFLGRAPGYRPSNMRDRYNRGGLSRIDAVRERWLFEFMDENVWPLAGSDAKRARRMFERFYEVWSVEPDDELPPVSAASRARLEAHYRRDAGALDVHRVRAPWIEAWDTCL